jgi:hypothetical protein
MTMRTTMRTNYSGLRQGIYQRVHPEIHQRKPAKETQIVLLAFRTATVRSKTNTKIGRDFWKSRRDPPESLTSYISRQNNGVTPFSCLLTGRTENEQTEWRRTNYMLKLGSVEFIESLMPFIISKLLQSTAGGR